MADSDVTVTVQVTVTLPEGTDTDDLVQFVENDLMASIGQVGGTNPITDVLTVRVV
jgi:hypothetical protein